MSRLSISLIPKALHGVNLRYALGKYRWGKLRKSILLERSLNCEVCGNKVTGTEKLHGHEEWVYGTSQVPALATLKRITFICWDCHACEHFLLTLKRSANGEMKGYNGKDVIDRLVAHFYTVNGWDRKTVEHEFDAAMYKLGSLSDLKWSVNYGPYASLVERSKELKTSLPHNSRVERTDHVDDAVTKGTFSSPRVDFDGDSPPSRQKRYRLKHPEIVREQRRRWRARKKSNAKTRPSSIASEAKVRSPSHYRPQI